MIYPRINISKALWFAKSKLTKFTYGEMGKHSYVGKTLFVQRRKNLKIGNNVRIYPGMRAELTKPSAFIQIEDNVSIGQNFHVVSYDGTLYVGRNTTISGNVFISNVDHSYGAIDMHVMEQQMIYKKTVIGENCFIGYGAVILPGTKLGKQCIVGANSVVKGEFEDYCVIVGNPARVIKRYNSKSRNWENV